MNSFDSGSNPDQLFLTKQNLILNGRQRDTLDQSVARLLSPSADVSLQYQLLFGHNLRPRIIPKTQLLITLILLLLGFFCALNILSPEFISAPAEN